MNTTRNALQSGLPGVARARQRGAILIMYTFMLMMVLGFAGLVTDLGLVYYRKTQLQNAADAIALAAAQKLDGTAAGVDAAELAAKRIAASRRLGVDGRLPWGNEDALRFSTTPDGGWVSSAQARVAPAGAVYAQFDVSRLAGTVYKTQPILMGVVGEVDGIDVGAVAVAGPTMIRATPLAICARNETESGTRTNTGGPNEQVTYGFRHGVTYNLLKQNPLGITPAYYLVNPVTPPAGTAEAADWDAIAPFMCAGKLAYAGSSGGKVYVRKPAAFDFSRHLNTRLQDQGGNVECSREGAPTDKNVKEYRGDTLIWQSYVAPAKRADVPSSAKSTTERGVLETVADLPSKPAGESYGHEAKDFGSLWAYGAAKKSGSGYMLRTDWPKLYPGGPGSSWSSAPYTLRGVGYYTAGPMPNRAGRRLMHIPLLHCADPGLASAQPRARVVAYGRFFLVASANANEVPGEFAGVEPEGNLLTNVEIFR